MNRFFSRRNTAATRRRSPVHPGELLAREFLEPLGLSQYRVAKSMGVPPRRINEIVLGKRSISADTALRLARLFGNSPEFWLNLQARHDLEKARDRAGAAIVAGVAPLHRARRRTTPPSPRPPSRRRAGPAPPPRT